LVTSLAGIESTLLPHVELPSKTRRIAAPRFANRSHRGTPRPWVLPATIEDPKVLDEIGTALKGRV